VPDPISTIKLISEVVKKYNDIELMHQIIELHSEVFELQKENPGLKKRLDQREKMQMKGPHGYFYQDGDEVPFCPKCWEADGKSIHLPASEDYVIGHGRVCRVCKHQYIEGPPTPRGGRRQAGGPWS
jgi:hypothetical protein